jgi:hypothetical protein
MSVTVRRLSRGGEVVLWLAMLAAVGVCAAGSYEHVVIVPVWTAAPPDSIAMFHGAHAIDTGRWWRVVHIPVFLLGVAAFLLLRGHPRRRLVGAGVVVYALVLALTGAWFLPELSALTRDPAALIAQDEWRARGRRWELASLARLALMYVSAGLLAWGASAPARAPGPR